jgi:hypothetical protein
MFPLLGNVLLNPNYVEKIRKTISCATICGDPVVSNRYYMVEVICVFHSSSFFNINCCPILMRRETLPN